MPTFGIQKCAFLLQFFLKEVTNHTFVDFKPKQMKISPKMRLRCQDDTIQEIKFPINPPWRPWNLPECGRGPCALGCNVQGKSTQKKCAEMHISWKLKTNKENWAKKRVQMCRAFPAGRRGARPIHHPPPLGSNLKVQSFRKLNPGILLLGIDPFLNPRSRGEIHWVRQFSKKN